MALRRSAALVALASTIAVGASSASVASGPYLYIRITGVAGAVDIYPTPTLVRECTSYCTYSFPPGTQSVRMTAVSSGGRFVTWATFDPRYPAPCTNSSTTCSFQLTTSMSIKAFFSPVMVVVHATAGGSATVDGRFCGSSCGLFDYGAVAHLRASVTDSRYVFSGWSGSCGSVGRNPACDLTARTNDEQSALFRCVDPSGCSTDGPYSTAIKVRVTVKGSGHVLGPRMTCQSGQTCYVSQDLGTQVTLRAVRDAGYFRGWLSNGIPCRSSVCQFPAAKTARGFDPQVVANFD
jgi:List-Bact-rpt repeat protein